MNLRPTKEGMGYVESVVDIGSDQNPHILIILLDPEQAATMARVLCSQCKSKGNKGFASCTGMGHEGTAEISNPSQPLTSEETIRGVIDESLCVERYTRTVDW
ncbi:MAG: hypothetical protein UX84_C0026G0008 [Microgenomates group bacterium GW2011_GWD1_47_13]|nr:MAG: hypothetical protein UX40_C0019G0002 [Microgenomates group bacterium GW2011_GWF2_46_18]KKU60466.1 MAG: hypothetical protein UX84_C0026G0008 [Microgenomates group bacterium GW2011_GWD1_47_13]HBD02589.1 hypothetical protein [Candidatus Collierbacteria bacterium]